MNKYYAFTEDCKISYLGEFDSMTDAMDKYSDIDSYIWFMSENDLNQLYLSIGEYL
jgi:hypothetical protein